MELPELELMLGQMVMMDLRGTTLPKDAAEMLKAGLVSGLVLFPGDDATPDQVRKLTDSIRAVSKTFPPIIAVDQEGGRVLRLKNGFTPIPAMRRLGGKNDETLAFETGKALGAELSTVGVNVDLAPVLDLDLNPENKVIGDRSLSPDPATVSRLGCALIRGLHSEKVAACAKHFPGHGASKEDSHLELPVVAADQKTVRERELVPFRDAIAAGVEMVMAGHILYPAFDKYHPASLSERLITELLREEMGFDRVVITDALEMKVLEGIPFEDRAFMAAKAGADILLVCDGIVSAKKIHMTLCQAVTMGALSMEKVYLSYQRIMSLKEKLTTQDDLPPASQVSRVVGSESHQKVAASF